MSTRKPSAPMTAAQLEIAFGAKPRTDTGKRRARKGGELGANREFYKGGQFVNTIAENPKGEAVTRPKAARREEFALRQYAIPPEGKRAIFAQLAGIYAYDRARDRFGTAPEAWRAYVGPVHAAALDALRDRYNAGERWA